jgi:3-deoxy-manno-octulosonate cytidylyltransferase (CMP-KDO synthetase)
MVEHVYRRAFEADGVDAVVVATDDERIASAVEAFGGVARMTRAGHRTGTDRVAETARDLRCNIVVNVQGDLPLVEPEMIAEAIVPLAEDGVQMSTLRQEISDAADHDNPNVVKVVVDRNGDALYFSRSRIPYCREDGVCFKHIGLYGFRRDFLLTFAALAHTPLEHTESLEQLRALEHGYRIRVVETRFDSIEVDTQEDLERVRRRMAAARV